MENLDDVKRSIENIIKFFDEKVAGLTLANQEANKKIEALEKRIEFLENDYDQSHHSVMMDKDYYDDYYK